MSAGASVAGGLTQKQVASYLMRTSGPELFFTQNYSAASSVIIPKQLQLLRPLYSLMLRFRFRVVVATAAATPAPEAPQSLIQRIRVYGTHRKWGAQVPIDLSGADLFAYARIFNVRGNSLKIAQAAGSSNYRQNELTDPMGLAAVGASGGAGTVGVAAFGSIGTFDVEIFYHLPVGPLGLPDAAHVGYLWNPDDWGDTLQVQIYFADPTAWNFVLANTTLTAFGSGAGTPTLDLLTCYASLGPLRNVIQQGVVIRGVAGVPGGVLTANGNLQRLQLLQKQKTTAVILKTGTSQAGTTAGVSSFGTLSDVLVDQCILRVDNKPLRNMFANSATKEFYGARNQTVQPQGYFAFQFMDGLPANNVLAAYPGDQLAGGSQFELVANIINASGTAIGEVIQEQILGDAVASA